MADSPHIPWPSLDAAYIDEFGRIDHDIHCAGGEIWPWAAKFARATLADEAAGHVALLKVCAKISAKRAAGKIQIETLNPYLKTAFKREILARLKANRLQTIDPRAEPEDDSEEDPDHKILIEQILTRMDQPNRRITQLLILGFSFEEIARNDGTQSNRLRSSYSKQLTKIRRELNGENPEA